MVAETLVLENSVLLVHYFETLDLFIICSNNTKLKFVLIFLLLVFTIMDK